MFTRARIKLTAWYLFFIMLVSVMFSVVIFRVLTMEIERAGRMQRFRAEHTITEEIILPDGRVIKRLPPAIFDPDLEEEVKHRILMALVIVNGGILVIGGGFGFILAGRTLAPIKRMMDEQNRFVSDASHELKTPLTSLKSAFEVYLRDRNRTKSDAETIIRESIGEVDRLQSLSESLLTLAQYDQPDQTEEFSDVNLGTVMRDAVKKTLPIANTGNVAIEMVIADITVSGDPYSLTQLFVILLDNAIKYSKPGGKVTVTVRRDDGMAVATVRDHGIGIEKKDIPHIFERFYRADSARVKNERGGYGLGLAIAKMIAVKHRGTIAVKSAPGKGSTFTVRIPGIRQTALPDDSAEIQKRSV